jgi:hypothetical protein
MRDNRELNKDFESFVLDVLTENGASRPPRHDKRAPDNGYDFLVQFSRLTIIVEVKVFQSLHVPVRNLINSAMQIVYAQRKIPGSQSLLVTNGRVSEQQRSAVESLEQVRIIDFDQLAALCRISPDLYLRFETLIKRAFIFRGADLPTPIETIEPITLAKFFDSPDTDPPKSDHPLPKKTGAELCAAIHNVRRSVGKEFETACENAIRFLFEEDFGEWRNQTSSHTAMHRFDLIARISSNIDFWQTIAHDFRARYIIFEFKNYSKPISQREIYTTEKYLYPIATRGAAIIVARNGADEGANSAMRGALRESAKLILCLSVQELCEMLHTKDAGGDHIALLALKLDEMLIGLER